MTRRNDNGANDAYIARAAEVRHILHAIEAKLESHAMRQATDRRNWGYAGDLAHVESQLREVMNFLCR